MGGGNDDPDRGNTGGLAGNPEPVMSAAAAARPSASSPRSSTNAGTLAERLSGTTWAVLPTPNPPGTQGDFISSVSCTSLSAWHRRRDGLRRPGPANPRGAVERGAVAHPAHPGSSRSFRPQQLLCRLPSPISLYRSRRLRNDGPGAKRLTEQWRATGTSDGQVTSADSSPQANRSILGCIRAAIGEGFTIGATAAHIEPMFRNPPPRQSRPASWIERVDSLCSTA